MTRRATVVTVALLAIGWMTAAASAAGQPRAATGEPRLEHLEHWLATALGHEPGRSDHAIVVVGQWTMPDLQVVQADVTAVVKLLRNPRLASQNETFTISIVRDRTEVPRPVLFPPKVVLRLKQISCAIGGFLETPPCAWVRPSLAGDAVLSSLAAAAADSRDENGNFILRRGAIVHSDIAMLGLAAPLAVDLSPGSRPVRMSIADGQQAALTQPDLHWEFARGLLDQIAAPGSSKPAPERDTMVREWYVATTAWMQRDGHHENKHLDRGREIFPDDADLAMLTGAQHEAYATAAVQTAVRSAVLPAGVKLDVGSERAELKDAEKFLRRAIELRPDFSEARIRLGRVLSLGGRDGEAAEQLNRGLASTEEPLLIYYGSLFLGTVDEKLGHLEAAAAAYERAAQLYPTAQSPLLGLSELARRAGRRDDALRAMARVYAIEDASITADPWWTYSYAQGRDADSRLERLHKPFRRPDQR